MDQSDTGRHLGDAVSMRLLGIGPITGGNEMEGILRRVYAWGRGSLDSITTPSDIVPERTIIAESAELLPSLLDSDLCGPGALILCPSPHAAVLTRGTTVFPYAGSLSAVGDEILLGEGLVVEVQEYAATHELTVIGPTLTRIASENDFRSFIYDADRAKEYGSFPLVLLDPMVQLCDLCVLGGAHLCGGPRRRLLVTLAGEVKTTPFGTTLGGVEDGLSSISASWKFRRRPPGSGCPVCLSQVVPLATVDAAHQQRPWLSRYLHALNALRSAAEAGLTDLDVSGFGGRLIPELTPVRATADFTLAASDSPILLFNSHIALLHDPRSKRQFQLGPSAARLVELMLVYGDHDAAADAAVLHLEVAPYTAHSALTQVTRRLAGNGITLIGSRGMRGSGPTESSWPRDHDAVSSQDPFNEWLSQAVAPSRLRPRIPRPKSG